MSGETSGGGPAAPHHHWVVTVFDDPGSLSQTLAALAEDGLDPGPICLLAQAETLTRFAAMADLKSVATEVIPEPAVDAVAGAETIEAEVAEALTAALVRIGALPTAEVSWPTDSRRRSPDVPGLARSLMAGHVVIVIGSAGPHQHRRCLRILLAVSTHMVTSYEFPRASTDAAVE